MKNRVRIMSVLLAALMLSGCGLLDNMPKPPKVTPPPAQTAAAPAEEAEAAVSEQEQEAEPAAAEILLQPEAAAPACGTLVHVERTEKTASDPAEGKTLILSYAWDSVRVDSVQHPEAAALITEELAKLQDVWYTGSGSEESGNIYGYDAMLGAAEDRFTIARESGTEPVVCSASRDITVLRADEDVCVFLVRTAADLGHGQENTVYEALCFDTATGRRIDEAIGDSTEEGIRAAVNARWPQKPATETATASLLPLDELPEDSIEIVDQVVIGDGGEVDLLVFSGTARDVEIWSVTFTDRFVPEAQLFHCGSLRDCALQLALLFPGDLPNTMLRYRDGAGEHEYLITLSGEDGSILLVGNRT